MINIDKPFLEQSLSKYFDQPIIADFKVMGEGQENLSAKVDLTDGRSIILRVWSDSHSTMGKRKTSDIESELDFMIHCNERDIPVPKVYSSLAGNRYELTSLGNYFVVMDFVAGNMPVNATPPMIHQIAEAMARMHLLAENYRYPAPRSYPHDGVIRETCDRLQRLPEVAAAEPYRAFTQPIQTAFKNALQAADLGALPGGPIHGDITWDNVKFQDGKLSGIYDFDDCRESYFLEDIAKTLIINFNDTEHGFFGEHGENVDTFMNAYEAVRPITDYERELLPFFFTLTYLYRLTRYLTKVVDSKLVYLDRMPALRDRYLRNQSFFLPTSLAEQNVTS